jgi:hypothetical protein
VVGRIRSIEKSSDLIGNQNRSIVPQPTILPHTPKSNYTLLESCCVYKEVVLSLVTFYSTVQYSLQHSETTFFSQSIHLINSDYFLSCINHLVFVVEVLCIF